MTEIADNTVVDGRYAIRDRIGSGGMADVYRADDTHLGREVALKVLHRRFAQDAEFVERFRREAKAAAGLQHPKVVSVYDRGEHEGTYYIAMECLPGRTLKAIVQAEAPLDQMRVIDLGVQILGAAGFAHRHGVIHRDFKPHNVIVGDDGAAKVTDFGIARAGASEMTETGSIMGTAQYLSPEQAQGHPVTATSDIYSIGVMLYELLTGRLPFDGDSAVSIALKHLNETPPPMSGPGLAIEPNLEQVVLGALAKDPAARWQSAEDFAAALEACRPWVEAQQRDGAAAAAVPLDATQVFAALPAAAGGPPATGDDDEEQKPHRRRWPLIVAVLSALVLLGTMIYAFTRPEEETVPKVEGLQLSEARLRLERAGFEKVEVERERSLAQVDRVLRQDPDTGEQAPTSDTVSLVVSSGPGATIVPSVAGLPQEAAAKELDKAGLKFTADPKPSDTVKKGLAIGTSPKDGERVDRGTRVRLFISSGPQGVTVPDVVGLSRDSAESRLDDEGLGVRVVLEASNQPEDDVISQTPVGGTKASKGDTVTITVSKGQEKADVPDVTGLTQSAALRQLRAAGFKASVRSRPVDNAAEDGLVVDQSPEGSTEANKGGTVVIFVGKFNSQTTPTPPVTPPATP